MVVLSALGGLLRYCPSRDMDYKFVAALSQAVIQIQAASITLTGARDAPVLSLGRADWCTRDQYSAPPRREGCDGQQ